MLSTHMCVFTFVLDKQVVGGAFIPQSVFALGFFVSSVQGTKNSAMCEIIVLPFDHQHTPMHACSTGCVFFGFIRRLCTSWLLGSNNSDRIAHENHMQNNKINTHTHPNDRRTDTYTRKQTEIRTRRDADHLFHEQ